MRIAEIYESIQGEGFLTGTRSVFVRASGCNLRCWFCDTPYASWHPEGDDWPVDELAARVEGFECGHVVLTGGEPMLFAEMIPLCERLGAMGKHVTIETAGTLYLPVECDLMSVSPKTRSSRPSPERNGRWADRHERARHVPEVIRQLVARYEYQLKFVIDRPEDCEDVERYLEEFPEIDRGRVMLMPQGTEPGCLAEKGSWLEPYCQGQGLHFCPRRQIEWFGSRRGT
ncbi:MAG: 7-carboxy-7-deazaguanine synthase QueE [Thermoguttaceae bacterium]